MLLQQSRKTGNHIFVSNYDPSEFLVVCESIIDDGELTYDELYRLADWLNNHHEACHHWPGNLLVEPLRRAWADGKITKTEARQVARLIVQIRKEAAKREVEEAFTQAVEAASQIVHSFDLTRPQLPPIPFSARFIVTQKSRRFLRGLILVVPPAPVLTSSHSLQNAHGHLARCCKHIFGAYAEVEPVGGWPGWLGAFMRLAWTPHPRQEWLVLNIRPAWFLLQFRPDLVLISSAPNGWADVFAPDDGQYDRYGYNVTEDRSAYNIVPRDADRIKKRPPLSQKGGAVKWPFSITAIANQD